MLEWPDSNWNSAGVRDLFQGSDTPDYVSPSLKEMEFLLFRDVCRGWLRCSLGFSLLRSSLMCIRGSRSSSGSSGVPIAVNLAVYVNYPFRTITFSSLISFSRDNWVEGSAIRAGLKIKKCFAPITTSCAWIRQNNYQNILTARS